MSLWRNHGCAFRRMRLWKFNDSQSTPFCGDADEIRNSSWFSFSKASFGEVLMISAFPSAWHDDFDMNRRVESGHFGGVHNFLYIFFQESRPANVIDYSATSWWIVFRTNFSNFSSSRPGSHVNQPTTPIKFALIHGAAYSITPDARPESSLYRLPADPTIHLFHFSRYIVVRRLFVCVSPFRLLRNAFLRRKDLLKTRARNEKRRKASTDLETFVHRHSKRFTQQHVNM